MPSKNPLYDSRQPVNTLMQLASDTPEYQQLANYLMARSAVPEVEFRYMGEDQTGEFNRNKKFIGGSSDHPGGTLSMSDRYTGYEGNPRQAVSTLGHELTHAAWNQMRQQIYEGKASPEFAAAFSKLVYNKPKGVWEMPDLSNNLDASLFSNPWGASQLAQRLDPAWAQKNGSYRASSSELPAFAVGNMMNNAPPGWKPPAHLDPTLATEQMILLDLATRDARRSPVKTTR